MIRERRERETLERIEAQRNKGRTSEKERPKRIIGKGIKKEIQDDRNTMAVEKRRKWRKGGMKREMNLK